MSTSQHIKAYLRGRFDSRPLGNEELDLLQILDQCCQEQRSVALGGGGVKLEIKKQNKKLKITLLADDRINNNKTNSIIFFSYSPNLRTSPVDSCSFLQEQLHHFEVRIEGGRQTEQVSLFG